MTRALRGLTRMNRTVALLTMVGASWRSSYPLASSRIARGAGRYGRLNLVREPLEFALARTKREGESARLGAECTRRSPLRKRKEKKRRYFFAGAPAPPPALAGAPGLAAGAAAAGAPAPTLAFLSPE